MKKVILLLLSIALICFTLGGLTACEDKNNSSQRPTYTFTGKEVSSSQTKVVIPSTYDKKNGYKYWC